jgi:hypothetical protein
VVVVVVVKRSVKDSAVAAEILFSYIYKTAIMPSTCCFVFWMDMFMFQSAVSWTPDKKFEFPGEVL